MGVTAQYLCESRGGGGMVRATVRVRVRVMVRGTGWGYHRGRRRSQPTTQIVTAQYVCESRCTQTCSEGDDDKGYGGVRVSMIKTVFCFYESGFGFR